MKKVCHISSAHPATDIRIFVKECTALAGEGYDVSFVVPTESSDLTGSVKIVGVPKGTGGRFSRMTKTVWAVYKKAKSLKADIYHFHDPELLTVALFLKTKNNRVIFDAHEDVSKQILGKYWINKWLRKFISVSFRIFENIITRRLDGVIAATPNIAKRFSGINKNVVNINNFPLLHELESGTDWENKKNEVCYVGVISRIRGCKEIIDAIGNIEGVKLNIAGNYSPAALREELASLDGWTKVNEFGLVGRKEVREILKNSRAGIVTFYGVPNHVDAQPNKMFEYMSAGVPVIGSDFPLWREIIVGNNCGICVNPEKSEEIAEAIRFILKNNEKAKEMGLNGRKAVIEKYNWEQEKLKLFEFYKHIGN